MSKDLVRELRSIKSSAFRISVGDRAADRIEALESRLTRARELLRLVTDAFEALGYRGVPGCVKDANAFLSESADGP